MLEKPYTINGNFYNDTPCVVRIEYGKKYVIAKCKNQHTGLKVIENGLNAFVRGGKNNPTGLYFHLFNYVIKNPNNKFRVKTLLHSENAYELLKLEQQELDKGANNPNFLNNQTEAYLPAYDYDLKSYGWIPQQHVINFKKWLKSRSKRTVQ